MTDVSSAQILTLGHSNHSAEHFQKLLVGNNVEVLVDVRSWPYSRHVKWADRAILPDVAAAAGSKYLFLGHELGGRPEAPQFYDASGHVLYARVAESKLFRDGLERLKSGVERYRIAIMCSEENPSSCHRRLLVAKVLLEQGLVVTHIRGDGRLETESEPIDLAGGALFDDEENLWRSSLSVSRKRPPRISSIA